MESFIGECKYMGILDDTLQYYTNQVLDDFKKSDVYKKLNTEVESLNCKIIVECSKSVDIKDNNIYLGITFCDECDKPIKIFDEGEMSTSISIVRVDKKNRYYFSHWQQDEFIDDITWLINKIKELKK